MDLLDLYERGSSWTASKISGAKDMLDSPTECDQWDVRALVNHLVSVKDLFVGAAKGEQVGGPPQGAPPDVVGDDPVTAYEDARGEILAAFREPGAVDKAGQMLGIAFADSLIHGWDLAKGTGQAASMPPDLAEAAYQLLNGQLTDDRRGDSFKPAVSVPDDASMQDKLLGYMGRQP